MGVEKVRRLILATQGISADDNAIEAAFTVSSTGSLATKAGFMVTAASGTTIKINGTAGGFVLGPLQVGAAASVDTRVAIGGVAGVQYASSTGSTVSIAIGDQLQSDNAGRVVAAAGDDYVIGIALATHSSGAAASTGIALITHGGIYSGASTA